MCLLLFKIKRGWLLLPKKFIYDTNRNPIPAVGGLNLEVEVALDVEVYLGT